MMAEKNITITVDTDALDPQGMRYFFHADMGDGVVVDMYYNDALEPLAETEKRYTGQFLIKELVRQADIVWDPDNPNTHAKAFDKIDGSEVKIKIK